MVGDSGGEDIVFKNSNYDHPDAATTSTTGLTRVLASHESKQS